MADSLLSDITPVASVTGSMELYVNVPGTPDMDGKATVDQVVTYAGGTFVPATRSVSAGTGLTGGGDLSANRTIGLDSASVTSLGKADTAVQPGALGNSAGLNVGTTAGTVAAGDDSRFTDARTPTAHASSHVTGGTDKIRDATASQDGLMTLAYAAKLDGVASGADVTATAIAAASTKATPVDADSLPLVDSEASNALKRITLTVLKTFINALTNPMTTIGDLIIGGTSGAVTRLAYVADGKILGGVSGSPAWVDPVGVPSVLVTESTTSRTLGLTDASKYIRLTNGSPCDITLPNQATVTWLADTEIYFRVAAAGIPTFTLGGSVVLNDPKGVVAALVQGDTFAIKRVASDTWDLI